MGKISYFVMGKTQAIYCNWVCLMQMKNFKT